MKKIDFTKKYLFVFFFLIIIFFIAVICSKNNSYQSIYTDNIDVLDDWIINGEKNVTHLENHKTYETICFENTIPSNDINCISFSSLNTIVKVYLNDELIYTFDKIFDMTETPGAIINYISFPMNSKGAKIKIELTPVFQRNTNTIPTFIVGEYSDIVLFNILNGLTNNIVNIFILSAGIILLLLYFAFRKELDSLYNLLYIAAFAIFFGIWSLTETAFAQVIFKSAQLKYFVCYISLYLYPLSFLVFIYNKNTLGKKYNNIVKYLITFHISYILITSCLQIFKILDFGKIVIIYHSLLMVEIIVLAIFIINYLFDDKSILKENFTKLLIIFLFCAFLTLDILKFYRNGSAQDSAVYSRWWILLFLIYMIYENIKDILNQIKLSKGAEEYKKLAYYDSLTGLKSRIAFNRKISKLFNESFWIISLDLNNLKYYNDSFGHEKGDEFLIQAGKIIKNSFGENSYRVGGDEFIIIVINKTQDELNEIINKFYNNIDSFNHFNNEFKLEIALGYYYRNKEEKIEDSLKIADEKMYQNKKYLKSK